MSLAFKGDEKVKITSGFLKKEAANTLHAVFAPATFVSSLISKAASVITGSVTIESHTQKGGEKHNFEI